MSLEEKEEFVDLDAPEEEDLEDFPDILSWYSLRVLRNEERCVAQIKEHVTMRNLQDKIVDIKFFKEFAIVESEEYDPHSEFLPKKGFKNTDKSIWVRLPNGNYKRIRVVERKPLSGMIFIKMLYDHDLFKMIRSWDAGYFFLGSPNPTPMSDIQLNKTVESLHSEMPNLVEYAQGKGYQIMDKRQLHIDKVEMEEAKKAAAEAEQEVVEEPLDAEDVSERVLTPEEEKEAQKARIYSELNIKQNVQTSFAPEAPQEKPKPTSKKSPTFNVNDFVFVKHLGFKGVIQEIDYDADRVIVGVQMFGRRQPVECKIKDIQLI